MRQALKQYLEQFQHQVRLELRILNDDPDQVGNVHQSVAQRHEVHLLGVPGVGRRDDIDEGKGVCVQLVIHGEAFVGNIKFRLTMDG